FERLTTGLLQFAQVFRGLPGVIAPNSIAGRVSNGNERIVVGSSAGLGAQPGGVMPFDRVAGTVPLPGRFVVTFQGIESLSVTTGEFEDLIKETKAPTAATTTITTAGGADSVDLAAVGGTTIVNAGADTDTVTLRASGTWTGLTINAGDGADF